MSKLHRLLFAVALFTLLLLGCGAALPKTPLQAVDASLVLACQGMAQAVAAKTNANAEAIVAKTCAVEGFTRTLRERLLSQQLEAAEAAGVAVPDINSGALEDNPGETQDAE